MPALGNRDLSFDTFVWLTIDMTWREAWKYQNRAYRYCLHDIGHAWQSLALAARSIGCESFAIGNFSDDRVVEAGLLSPDEWPVRNGFSGLNHPSTVLYRH